MASMTLEEMEAKRDELEIAIAGIKAQLREARSQAWETGEYADPNWYNSAEYALSMKGIEFNRVCRDIKAAKKAQAKERDREWEKAFVRMARQTLNEETFDRLVALAWEETGGRP